MKAIIEIVKPDDFASRALQIARHVDRGEEVPEADYRLGFASAHLLFRELTPERLRVLECLKQQGALSIYALARQLKRNYSNVHRDVKALMELELIAKDDAGKVLVPWDAVELRLSFGSERSVA